MLGGYVDATTLQQLLEQPESATLEFKQAMYKINDRDGDTKKHHRGELIKDILSLANGNASVAGQTSYLVIGAADQIEEDGSRQLYDITAKLPAARSLLSLINSVCLPALDDLKCEEVILDGHRLIVITILPSPHLHETSRKLDASQTYTEHVVFIRRVDSVDVANAGERSVILRMKQFHFEQSLRMSSRMLGFISGVSVGGAVPEVVIKLSMPDAKLTPSFKVFGAVLGGLLGLLIGNSSRDMLRLLFELRALPDRWRYLIVSVVAGLSGSAPYLYRFFRRWLRK